MPAIPRESMYYFTLGDRYLPHWAAALMQLLLFAPLGYAFAAGWRQANPAGVCCARAFGREFRRWLVLFGAGAILAWRSAVPGGVDTAQQLQIKA